MSPTLISALNGDTISSRHCGPSSTQIAQSARPSCDHRANPDGEQIDGYRVPAKSADAGQPSVPQAEPRTATTQVRQGGCRRRTVCPAR
jgi:hypothetical protein